MLDLGTNIGFDFLGFQLVGIQLAPGARPFGNEPGDVFAVLMLIPLLNTKVSGIAEAPLLFTVQQLIGVHDVMNVGSFLIDAMNQARLTVDANVPFVALSGLVHLRVAFACAVFGGARSRDNGPIYDGAFTQHQPVLRQMFVLLFKQRHAKIELPQKVAELKDCRFVWQTVQLQLSVLAHGFDLVQSVFHGRIAQVIEQLHSVGPQHNRQEMGRLTVLALWVIAGYFLFQLLLGNQLVHPFQKNLGTCLAFLLWYSASEKVI